MNQIPGQDGPTVIVGVEPDQSPSVIAAVAPLAATLGAKVVCLHVQSGRTITQALPESLEDVAKRIPGFDDEDEAGGQFPAELGRHLDQVFRAAGVHWEPRWVEGDPAKALGRLAEELDAMMIVVGTRRRGLRNRMAEFIDGSVAVHLAHKQNRPVLVVPQVPNHTGQLPWND